MRVHLTLSVAVCVFMVGAHGDGRPWWDNFPRIISTDDLSTAQAHNASVAVIAHHRDPGWGTYGQILGAAPSRQELFQSAGFKTMAYYETYGESYCYLAEVGEWDEVNLTPRYAHDWNWQNYGGRAIRWIGVQNFWDDEDFARPYTRTHPRYGAPPLTYPDGTVATGYFGDDPTDPRNSRVFDASISKDIWGNLSLEYNFNAAINAIDPDTGLPYGPLDGTVPVGDQYASLMLFHKDSACPNWHGFTYASTLMGADAGLDGMWSDNWGTWDSFGRPPLTKSFGDWSVARFRDYLANNLTSAELSAMGVSDPATFDVRAGLRAQAAAWGGDDTNLYDFVWRDVRWLDHPLWMAYLIFKRQAGTEALQGYAAQVRAAAAAAGKDEYLIAGNDVGGYSFGWPRGELDLASFEMTAGWRLSQGPRGFMLPPVGRYMPRYKVAREHTRSRFVNVWLYKDGYEAELSNPNLTTLIYYEMLTSHALPMFSPGNPRFAGTPANNSAFFAFVEQAAPVFGRRMPLEEIGVLYSTSSLLTFMTPFDFYDHGRQPHQFGIFGWATALQELHKQWRYVPEWKMTPEELAGLKVLIISNAEVVPPDMVEKVIAPWAAAGGRLIVTGENNGTRLGEDGNFAANPEGSSLSGLTGPDGPTNVWHTTENVGLDYYQDKGARRPALLAAMKANLDTFLGDTDLLIGGDDGVPSTMGLTVFAEESTGRIFVDVNNFDIDTASDTVNPAPAVSFDVRLPDWMSAPSLTVLSPDEGVSAQVMAVTDTHATLSVGPFDYYACLILRTSVDPGDWSYHEQGGAIISVPHEDAVFENGPLMLIAPEGTNYQWYRDDVPLEDDDPRLTGANARILVFDPVLRFDEGVYRCAYDSEHQAYMVTHPHLLGVMPRTQVPVAGVTALAAVAAACLAAGIATVSRRTASRP